MIPSAGVQVSSDNEFIDAYVSGWSQPQHYLKSNVAQEPLEDGAVITDHVVALPVSLDLKGYVSDVKDGAVAAGYAWQKIKEIQENEQLLNVLTEWGFYENMAIRTAETKQTGRGLMFSMSLVEVLKVAISVEDLPGEVEDPATPRGWRLVLTNWNFQQFGTDSQGTRIEPGVRASEEAIRLNTSSQGVKILPYSPHNWNGDQ